jgi:hypothetical protein
MATLTWELPIPSTDLRRSEDVFGTSAADYIPTGMPADSSESAAETDNLDDQSEVRGRVGQAVNQAQVPRVDAQIAELISEDWREPDQLFEGLVVRARGGDMPLIQQLFLAAINFVPGSHVETDARRLAIEVLASSHHPQAERYLLHAILALLATDDEDLRFSAIAASSDVASLWRASVARTIRKMLDENILGPDSTSAALAFLSSVKA